jgi:hypothetical protein
VVLMASATMGHGALNNQRAFAASSELMCIQTSGDGSTACALGTPFITSPSDA